jgi:hypothetical protein
MNGIPGFTATHALPRSGTHYRTAQAPSAPSGDIVLAYYPSQSNVDKCQGCLDGCMQESALCFLGAIFWPPAIAACSLNMMRCQGACAIPGTACCPKVCELMPFNQPGGGCCDADDTCMPNGTPNTRGGCCPSNRTCGRNCCAPGQSCCNGNCCNPGDTCCGGQCCPSDHFCRDGTCSPWPGPLFGPPEDKTDVRHPGGLLSGWDKVKSTCVWPYTSCGDQCCEPGLECCYRFGRYRCMTNCLQ